MLMRSVMIAERCFSARLMYVGSFDTKRPTRLSATIIESWRPDIRCRYVRSRLQELRGKVNDDGRLHDVNRECH